MVSRRAPPVLVLTLVLAVLSALPVHCVSAAPPPPPPPETVLVHTPDGIVRGTVAKGSGVRVFKGIPYAAPPVGPLRWQPPKPRPAWEGVLNATVPGPACTKVEDCLYLNVWTPPGAAATPPLAEKSEKKPHGRPQRQRQQPWLLPVMVWIHGGCYVYGSGSQPDYSGEHDAAAYRDVVVVTLNYRLGVLGFLGSAEIKSRTSDGSAGNFGLQDQRLALDWVRRNIASFGGDPSAVTIFGQSAGAGSVAAHLAMNRSWTLFHRAILQSGAMEPWNSLPLVGAEQTYRWLLNQTQCGDLDCLLEQPFLSMVYAGGSAPGWCQYKPRFTAVVDGVELAEEVFAAVEGGRHARVPVIAGSTRDEAVSFMPLRRNASQPQYLAYLNALYNTTVAAEVQKQYPPASFQANPYYSSACQAWTDCFMGCGSRRISRWLASPSASPNNNNTFLYFFTKTPPLQRSSPHGAEIPYVFANPSVLALDTAAGRTLAHLMGEYWTNFAATGDPNRPASWSGHTPPAVQWRPFDPSRTNALQLDDEVTEIEGWKDTRCDFWDGLLHEGCDQPPPGWAATC